MSITLNVCSESAFGGCLTVTETSHEAIYLFLDSVRSNTEAERKNRRQSKAMRHAEIAAGAANVVQKHVPFQERRLREGNLLPAQDQRHTVGGEPAAFDIVRFLGICRTESGTQVSLPIPCSVKAPLTDCGRSDR